jgi:hypothetical protein
VAEAERRRVKLVVVERVESGLTVADAVEGTGFAASTVARWSREDAAFNAALDSAARAARAGRGSARGSGLGFEEFRLRYLGMRTFDHQRSIIDVIEGREPSWKPPGVFYHQGYPNFVLCNVPPEHAKSMTVSVDYLTYRIALDPNVRILIVSKTRDKAREFVYAVKQRLTHPRYQALQMEFGPEDGYRSTSEKWSADTVYLGSELRDSAEKDPTLQALGIGGQIYGARADLIVLDDCVTLSNCSEFEKQIRWVQQEVLTRLGPSGRLVVVGTRVDTRDLYSEITDPERYPSGESPWTVLRMPAVLSFDEDPRKWVTLWPRSDQAWAGSDDEPDDEGLFPRWDGPSLHRRRGLLDPRTWSMVYMQAEVSAAAVFPSRLVRATVSGGRFPGPLVPGAPHMPESVDSFDIIAGLDPAMTMDTAAVVMAVDRRTKHRWVLDAHRMGNPTPAAIRELITEWQERYRPSMWVIEKNAFQLFLTQDEGIRTFLASRGVILREHYTGRNKIDADYGVASMAPLFGQLDGEGKAVVVDPIIHLPSTSVSEGTKALVEQLITWSPATRNKTDLVMALWFPLPLSTPVLTDHGWETMGTLEVGHRVATATGEWTPVEALSPIHRSEVLRVRFDDGTHLDASPEHRWWVTPVDRGAAKKEPRWMTTAELADNPYKRVMVRFPEPLDGPDADLPLDPYVLGVWLGDGDARQGTIFGHADDTPFIREQFEMAGFPTTDQKRGYCFGTHGLRTVLGQMGLLGNKHVPEEYLRGSLKQRLALLQGLMDTDGTVIPGRSRSYFANTNKQLVDSVIELCRTLGFRPNVQEVSPTTLEKAQFPQRRTDPSRKPSAQPKQWKTHWRVLFTPSAQTLNPFRMPRKAVRVDAFANDAKPRRYMTVKAVEPVGEDDVRCITVRDGSHVFLAGAALIPTGNCELRAREIVNSYDQFGKAHMGNRFLTPAQRSRRVVVNLDEAFWLKQQAEVG